MASPILHIKDSYYLEVPKMLHRSRRESIQDFPEFWVKLDPDYQRWEGGKLHGILADSDSDVPAWPQLRQAYLEWKEHDHHNFGKPLKRFPSKN